MQPIDLDAEPVAASTNATGRLTLLAVAVVAVLGVAVATVVLRADGDDEPIGLAVAAAATLEANTASYRMTSDVVPDAFVGHFQLDPDAGYALIEDPGFGTLEIRWVDLETWFSDGEGQWIEAYPEDGRSLGLLMNTLFAVLLEDLAASDTTGPGTPDEIDGRAAHRHDIDVDLNAAVEARVGALGENITMGVFRASAVWIDDDGLVVQVRMTGEGETILISFADHGDPVDIQRPPADQILTEDDLREEFERERFDEVGNELVEEGGG